MRRLVFAVLAAVVWGAPLAAQAANAAAVRAKVRAYRVANDTAILRELIGLLAIPNLASDSVHIRENAGRLVSMLERRGVRAQLLESPGSPPAVYGELSTPGVTRTVMLYAHYDGQPVDSTQWETPPWTPTLRNGVLGEGGKVVALADVARTHDVGEWRLYARSASDDKAPIIAMLTALDALRAAKLPLSVNLKLFLEGEEEAGSPHLREMLTRHADLLRADLWLFGDGPVHQSRRMQVVFGVRGVTDVEMTVYGPRRPLHSGHYGNWAPNPIVMLAELVTSMRDSDGRIRIAHFLDDVTPPTAAERRALASVPPVDSALRAELQLGRTEGNGAPLVERIMLPALNLRGFQAGAVGASAANAIPTEARVSIDFRLVPRQTPERIQQLVESHARAKGFYVVHEEPSADVRRQHPKIVRMEWGVGYPAARTPLDAPQARAVVQVVEEAIGAPVVRLPTLGGSLPIYLFEDVLKTPPIVLPIVNHDNNQHAANENVRLQNLWDGVDVFAALMARLGTEWKER